MQKIVDFAEDNKGKLKDKYMTLIEYTRAHADIAVRNVTRKAGEDARQMNQAASTSPTPATQVFHALYFLL